MPERVESPAGHTNEFDARSTIDGGITQLMGELQAGRSERLERYLSFASRFYRYSTYNQMLIWLQCPQATHVAGYRAWQEMGYQVRRGEQGIRILAPRTHKEIDPDTRAEREHVHFVPVSVFDASQLLITADKPLPEFFTPLADDQREFCHRLHAVIANEGIRITEEETGAAQGYSAGGRIAVRAGLDSTSKALTVLHEFAHEILHWSREGHGMPRAARECQAEAVAYVVAHHFGIRNPYSADYLQAWGNTVGSLLGELEAVRRASDYIIERIERFGEPVQAGTDQRIAATPG